jgi:hypothetical protein
MLQPINGRGYVMWNGLAVLPVSHGRVDTQHWQS